MQDQAIVQRYGVSYSRLSLEEFKSGESGSIINQRAIIQSFADSNAIVIVKEFADDGFSGANFERPGFLAMLEYLAKNVQVTTVITKDLSRLGRNMRESSQYAEEYFPEHGIRYIAPGDNFDSGKINLMAPFSFAMNDVYLRQGSKKVRDVLASKRDLGQYCTSAPYGYQKDKEKSRLIVDEETAPIVKMIFDLAANGESSWKIAEALDAKGVLPPLKHKVVNQGNFSESGAARASDLWVNTTVKRILRNKVYLGHTLLGKTEKVSYKSKQKKKIPESEWRVTPNTHPPIVSDELFEIAQKNLAHNTKAAASHTHTRKSIFGKLLFCELCGRAMCSGGTTYKGERDKYWFLVCNSIRAKGDAHCTGARIQYHEFAEIVRKDINKMIALTDEEILELVSETAERDRKRDSKASLSVRLRSAEQRMASIIKIISKLYGDNADGVLGEESLREMVATHEKESSALRTQIAQLKAQLQSESDYKDKCAAFSKLARQYTHIETLDREALLTFVERIDVGPKLWLNGTKGTNQHSPYRQTITISYKFIGPVDAELGQDASEASGF